MDVELRVSGGTRRERVYDLVAGIALPIVRLLADPGVFRGWAYRPVVYVFIGTEILVLAAGLPLLVGRRRASSSTED